MELEKSFVKYIIDIYGKDNAKLIEKAFKFAEKKHQGQMRDTGEDYNMHPYAVARYLAEMRADVETVISGFLHDCLEDTDCKPSEIKKEFGETVLNICDGASKIEKIKHARRAHEEETENLRKMFLAMNKDARVAFVKLADRLHNMQTLDVKPKDAQLKIAKETLDLHVALAERLCMNSLKHNLEDLCFKYLFPKEFKDVTKYLNEYYKKSQSIIEDIKGVLSKIAKDNNVDAKIQSRLKSTFGVYKKTLTRDKDKIYDIIAHRIIVKDIKNCYTMLGAVHNLWKPLEGRIKDYIASPKKNGYMSLHTTVMYPTEKGFVPVEIQIRTESMHIFCEYGMAAHWMYKEHGSKATGTNGNLALYNLKKAQSEETEKINQSGEVDEFLEIVRTGFYADKIFVFTPSYNVIDLPEGSITLDFAYAVHTSVGNRCVGAKVNGKIVPITTKLKTGDEVEILTSKDKEPSRDWVKMCVSSSAIAKIRNFFKKERKDENIKIGKDILEEAAKRKNCVMTKILDEKDIINEILINKSFLSVDEMFAAIGYGGLYAETVVNKYLSKKQIASKPAAKIAAAIKAEAKDSQGILVDGHSDLLKNLAKCCNPIPGDEILAYVSNGRGLVIHRCDCENLDKLDSSRFIAADWNLPKDETFTFMSYIEVIAKNKNNIYIEVANAMSELSIKVVSLNSSESKNDELVIKIGVQIKNKSQLQQAKNKLASLPLVFEVL